MLKLGPPNPPRPTPTMPYSFGHELRVWKICWIQLVGDTPTEIYVYNWRITNQEPCWQRMTRSMKLRQKKRLMALPSRRPPPQCQVNNIPYQIAPCKLIKFKIHWNLTTRIVNLDYNLWMYVMDSWGFIHNVHP